LEHLATTEKTAMNIRIYWTRLAPALAALALSLSAQPALAQGQPGPGYGYGPHMMWDGWTGWMMGPLAMLLWIAVLVVLAVLLFRWLAGRGDAPPRGTRSAIDILRERYARGEIDREEYEERRRVLEGR
jgi:putative membrane protein